MLVHTYIYNIVLIDNINTNFYTSFRFLLNFEPIDSTTRVIIHAAAFRRRLEVGCGMAEHEIPEGTANLWRRKRCGEPRRAKPYHLRRFESPSFLPEHSIDSREREVAARYPLIGIAGNVYWPTEFRNKFPFYFRSPSPSFFINRGIPPNTSISFTIF